MSSDIYLVKEGSPARRILGTEDGNVNQWCPAFSPDGARLVAGEADSLGAGFAHLVITDLNVDGKPFDWTTLALDGVKDPPCAIWSADGRWLAFGVGPDERGYLPRTSDVWVLDTQTKNIRRLGVGATDIEWAPNGPELFIAGDGITVYSATTDTTRRVENTSGAVAISFSPDGRSLVVEHDSNGDAQGQSTLLLMGADGSDQRILVANYDVSHGIGPVWSPDGNRVVFQRHCATYVIEPGLEGACYEMHEVVVVTVSDQHPHGPFGTLKVIAPPRTTWDGEARVWAPYSVTWSPDSTTLLYIDWSRGNPDHSVQGILAVPVDSATPPVVIEDFLRDEPHGGEPWNTFQSWSKQRG